MEDMGRNRPLYLQSHTTRHGKTVWYVRVKRGPLVRLRSEYGTEAFNDEYRAALAGAPITKPAPNSKSLQWLYDRYRETEAWSGLSQATRRQRENILGNVMVKSGHEPFEAIARADIEGGKDDRRETPAQARNFLDAMRGLFRWALKNAHVEADPTDGVDNPQRLSGAPGFPAWDEDDLALYYAQWPVGTRERVWCDVLLYTGLRRGDAVKAGEQHIKDGVLSLKTEKTGMVMHCVIDPELRVTLDKGPTGDLAFICGVSGEPLAKETFGNMFRDACNKAGVKKSAHGLRKLAATIDAERGFTERELEAKYGWTGGYMASLYTRTADRKRMAIEAARRSMILPKIQRVLPAKSVSNNSGLEGPKTLLVRSRKVP